MFKLNFSFKIFLLSALLYNNSTFSAHAQVKEQEEEKFQKKEKEEVSECSICTESLALPKGVLYSKAIGNTVINLQCNETNPHFFHIKCIGPWSERNANHVTCPYCRVAIDSHRDNKLFLLYQSSLLIQSMEGVSDIVLYHLNGQKIPQPMLAFVNQFRLKQLATLEKKIKQQNQKRKKEQPNEVIKELKTRIEKLESEKEQLESNTVIRVQKIDNLKSVQQKLQQTKNSLSKENSRHRLIIGQQRQTVSGHMETISRLNGTNDGHIREKESLRQKNRYLTFGSLALGATSLGLGWKLWNRSLVQRR